MFMQTDKSVCMSVELDVCLWKSTFKIGVEFLLIFFLFINFMKILIKSIITARLCVWTVYLFILWKFYIRLLCIGS